MHAVVLFTLSFYAHYLSVHTLLLCALSSAHTLFYTQSTPDTPIAGAPPLSGRNTGEVYTVVNSPYGGTGFRSLRALQRWSRDRSRRSRNLR